jgi:predicted Ser/Thr protein kinase
MTRCISCASEIPGYQPILLSGVRQAGDTTDNSETAVMPMASTPRSGGGESRAAAVPARVSSSDGRFAAGVVVTARYQIIGLLGKGGMGEVYRANDLTLDQPVALKFLPESMARDAAMLARFHNEVRIARQVSHPNVCRVYDLGEVDGQPYLSMEYIDGEDLGSLLRRIGRLPSDKALEFARRICAGLAAAHDKGVLHRDLKPSNIMVDSQGQVFITDFGLAAVTGELREAQAREGTPAYMAPEQLAGTEVTARSDIYSLGLVLYEMFAGKRPFEAGTLAEMIRLQQQSTPASLTTVVKDVDPAVERVIQRCLAADPRQRPATALAVAAGAAGRRSVGGRAGRGRNSVARSGGRGRPAGGHPAGVGPGLPGRYNRRSGGGHADRPARATGLASGHGASARSAGGKEPRSGPRAGIHGEAYGSGARFHLRPRLPAVRRAYRQVAGRWEHRLGNAQPPPIVLVSREPAPLQPEAFGLGTVDPNDPPPIVSGMVSVTLDPQGRLVEFDAVPPQVDTDHPARSRRRIGSACSMRRVWTCRGFPRQRRSGRRWASATRAPPGPAFSPAGRRTRCAWRPPPGAASPSTSRSSGPGPVRNACRPLCSTRV